MWQGGRVVMQRPAKPWTSVRFRSLPPRILGPGGGIGRRYGLKIRCPKGRAGSSPALGTKFNYLELLISSFLFATKAIKASLTDGSRVGCS